MNTHEVFAINIQPRQFITDLRVKPEDVETERAKFLCWLESIRKQFMSQMDAWNVWVSYVAPSATLDAIKYTSDKSDDEIEFDAILNRAIYGWMFEDFDGKTWVKNRKRMYEPLP